jgi:hypothetical protein
MLVSTPGTSRHARTADRAAPSPICRCVAKHDLCAVQSLKIGKCLFWPLVGDRKAEPIAPEFQPAADITDEQLGH